MADEHTTAGAAPAAPAQAPTPKPPAAIDKPGPASAPPQATAPPQAAAAPGGPTAAPDAAPTLGAAPDAGAQGTGQVALEFEEIVARAAQRDEYLELAQRARADFENYRKRVARDAASAESRAVVRLVRELLPAIDNLERALAVAAAERPDGQGDQLLDGMRLVRADLAGALARAGVESYTPQGERFDPELHEAIAQQAVAGAAPGTVVEVYQAGYRLNGSLIRPARVVVAGAPPTGEDAAQPTTAEPTEDRGR